MGADLAVGSEPLKEIESLLRELTIASTKNSQKQLSVLVVEDLDAPRDIICAYLESKGLGGICGVTSGEEALTELNKDTKKYGCIISDIRMPRMQGNELVTLVRRTPAIQHIPIIMLTAYGSVDSLVECLRVGATGYLLKPPRIQDLQREIERAFRMVRLGISPRLATEREAESVRARLLEKGFT